VGLREKEMLMAVLVMQPGEAIVTMVGPEGRQNPYPFYEAIRAHGNLVQVKEGTMVAVGYAEIDRALREPQLKVQDWKSFDHVYPEWRSHSSLRGYTDSMLYRNAPDHPRMRRLVNGGFTPRRVTSMRPAIEKMADRLLDHMEDLGADGSPVDFIPEFASRLPIAVISELLGVPEEDHVWFRSVAADLTLALEGINTVSGLDPADAAMDDLSAYFSALIDHRRHQPVDDMVSALVQVHHTDGDRLSQDELLGNMMLLLTAGFETTTFLLGHALLLAFEHPHFAERLRSEPGFADGYVEELLRFEPPVQATTRWAGADVDVLGTRVPDGTKLILILAAGNRDPLRFDEPDRFNPDRRDIQPLTFGAGSHFCLGSPLARMEAQIALPRLLRRFPGLAIAATPVRRNTWVGRGLDFFPVTIR
jgi:cytochrome P450